MKQGQCCYVFIHEVVVGGSEVGDKRAMYLLACSKDMIIKAPSYPCPNLCPQADDAPHPHSFVLLVPINHYLFI